MGCVLFGILIVCWIVHEIFVIIAFFGSEYKSRKEFVFDILVPFGALFRNGKNIFKNMEK